MKLRLIWAAAAIGILAAACSTPKSADKGSRSTSSSTITHGSSATTAPAGSGNPSQTRSFAADKTLAQSELWKLTDFPAGWTSQPVDTSTGDATMNATLDQCLGASVSFLQDNQASADSPNFNDSSNDSAGETVVYLPSAAQGESDFSVVMGPKFPQCFASTVNSMIEGEILHPNGPNNALPPGAAIGQATVSPMAFPAMGDHTAAFRVIMPISYQGANIDAYVDMVSVLKGRAVSMMTFQSVMHTFDISLEEKLAAISTVRMGVQGTTNGV